MMDTRTGEFEMMTADEFRRALAGPPQTDKVLVAATEEEIVRLSRAVKRSASEDEARRSRRKAQKDARRRNRA